MARETELRFYRSGDEEDIVDLLTEVFDGWPHFDLPCSPVEHWRWKYLDNPFKRNWIVLGTAEDRIVGCTHSTPITVKLGDREYYSSHGYDLAVHPDYRGLGLSTRMYEMRNNTRVNDGVVFTYSESGNLTHRKSLEKRYPRFPHTISRYIRVIDVDLHFEYNPAPNQWLKKTGIGIFRKLNAFKGLRTRVSPNDISLKHITKFSENIDCFWEENKHQYNYAIRRDYRRLNWRYCDPRAGEYNVYVAMEAETILGYIVLRINKVNPHYPRGCIIDLQTPITRTEVAELLINRAIKFFGEENVNYVSVNVVDGHSYIRLLQRYGFINSGYNIVLFCSHYTGDQNDFQKVVESPSSSIWFCDGDRDSI